MQNITFHELNSFVDENVSDLPQWLNTFNLQAEEANKFSQSTGSHNQQMNDLARKLAALKYLQETIDCNIAQISRYETAIGDWIGRFEKAMASVKYETPVDRHRQKIYKHAENIFVSLNNCQEAMGMVSSQTTKHERELLKDPIEKVAKIMEKHLGMLESIEMKIMHMKNYLQSLDGVKAKLLGRQRNKFTKH